MGSALPRGEKRVIQTGAVGPTMKTILQMSQGRCHILYTVGLLKKSIVADMVITIITLQSSTAYDDEPLVTHISCLFNHLKARHDRHHDIGNDNVGLHGHDELESLATIAR